eukprot:TRINITY_DN2641_c0_g1_i4.p1 TRINITY_DN2641_c0_g1~~TRINITY_DN2641_c0_g1_i4.p1  ORF type:complete len:678 (+),score=164.75 TRINITY_DN2641_c0_g1_i4:237-2270(+)
MPMESDDEELGVQEIRHERKGRRLVTNAEVLDLELVVRSGRKKTTRLMSNGSKVDAGRMAQTPRSNHMPQTPRSNHCTPRSNSRHRTFRVPVDTGSEVDVELRKSISTPKSTPRSRACKVEVQAPVGPRPYAWFHPKHMKLSELSAKKGHATTLMPAAGRSTAKAVAQRRADQTADRRDAPPSKAFYHQTDVGRLQHVIQFTGSHVMPVTNKNRYEESEDELDDENEEAEEEVDDREQWTDDDEGKSEGDSSSAKSSRQPSKELLPPPPPERVHTSTLRTKKSFVAPSEPGSRRGSGASEIGGISDGDRKPLGVFWSIYGSGSKDLNINATLVEAQMSEALGYLCQRRNHAKYLRDRIYSKRCQELGLRTNSGVDKYLLSNPVCFCNLEIVNMRDLLLGDRGVQGILPLLRSARRLRSFNLAGNCLRELGVEKLSQALLDPGTVLKLCCLDLSKNPLSSASAGDLQHLVTKRQSVLLLGLKNTDLPMLRRQSLVRSCMARLAETEPLEMCEVWKMASPEYNFQDTDLWVKCGALVEQYSGVKEAAEAAEQNDSKARKTLNKVRSSILADFQKLQTHQTPGGPRMAGPLTKMQSESFLDLGAMMASMGMGGGSGDLSPLASEGDAASPRGPVAGELMLGPAEGGSLAVCAEGSLQHPAPPILAEGETEVPSLASGGGP